MHIGQHGKVTRDNFKRLKHTWLECGFHRGQRHVGLIFIIIVIVFGNWIAVCIQFLCFFAFSSGCCRCARRNNSDFFFAVFTHRVAEGRFKINNVAQQNVFAQQFVAPDRNRLERQWAFTKPKDHRVAASLDAFRNGDFTFT